MNAALHLFHHLTLRSRPDQHTYSREDERMDGYIYSRTRNLWTLIKFWACFNVLYASVFWSVSHLYVFYRPGARRRLSRLPLCSPHMLFFILTAPAFDLSSSLSISPRDASLFWVIVARAVQSLDCPYEEHHLLFVFTSSLFWVSKLNSCTNKRVVLHRQTVLTSPSENLKLTSSFAVLALLSSWIPELQSG